MSSQVGDAPRVTRAKRATSTSKRSVAHRSSNAPFSRRQLGQAVVATLLGLVTALLAWLRLPPVVRGTVWAEDAHIFLTERYQYGVGGSLFRVYAGYLQFTPRILTDVATTIEPLSRYATTITALVCLTSGGAAAVVYLCSRDVVRAPAARLVLASITVLAPLLPYELSGNLANIHSVFLWLTPWILLFRPTRWWQSGVLAAVVLAAGLTEIQVGLFIPLVAFGLANRRSWPVKAALVVGVAAQLTVAVVSPRAPSSGTHLNALDIIKGYLAQAVLPLYEPSTTAIGNTLTTVGWKGAGLLLIPFLAAFVFLAVRARRWDLLALLTIAAAATAPWVAGTVANALPHSQYDEFTAQQLAQPIFLRYGVVPSMFLLALIVLVADRLLRHRTGPRIVSGVALLLAVMVIQLVSFHLPHTSRDAGPIWSQEIPAALQTCHAGAARASIAAAPRGWTASVPCRVVDATH